jgi:5S rRNA maturation endonuclease (ribonuclease M5)
MNMLNDLIYFTYIGVEEKTLLEKMYKVNPKIFLEHLNQLFDIEFRNKILELVGEPLVANPEGAQAEIDAIFTDIAHHLHFMMSETGRDFWHSRGITDAQIVEYQLGDNYIWLPSLQAPGEFVLPGFSFAGDPAFFPELGKRYNPTYVKQAFKSMYDQIKTAERLYGSGHAVSCPSFDSKGKCRGIVFRILHYKKNEKSLKNMYKFYNPFSWSYLFNFKTVEENDELIMVEGVTDAMALLRAGYKNVISPSMVRLSPYHTRILKDKKLHVLFDHDRGGLEGLKFIKDHFENQDNLVTLALCPTTRDFDEMTLEEIHHYMDHVSEYDVRNLTSKPVEKHAIKRGNE